MTTNGHKEISNREFAATDTEFRSACQQAGIPATQRQASKWRLRTGKAYECRFAKNGTESLDDTLHLP